MSQTTSKPDRVVAVSMHRHRATAAEKRAHGGATVTEFCVYRAADEGDAGKYATVRGFGPTPGERKTDAIRRYLALPRAVDLDFVVETKPGLSDALVGDAQARTFAVRHRCQVVRCVRREGPAAGHPIYRFRGEPEALRALCRAHAGDADEGDYLYSLATVEVS